MPVNWPYYYKNTLWFSAKKVWSRFLTCIKFFWLVLLCNLFSNKQIDGCNFLSIFVLPMIGMSQLSLVRSRGVLNPGGVQLSVCDIQSLCIDQYFDNFVCTTQCKLYLKNSMVLIYFIHSWQRRFWENARTSHGSKLNVPLCDVLTFCQKSLWERIILSKVQIVCYRWPQVLCCSMVFELTLSASVTISSTTCMQNTSVVGLVLDLQLWLQFQ